MPLIRLIVLLGVFACTAHFAHAQDNPLKDANGDLLPPGAIGRVGSLRFRVSAPVVGARFVEGGKKLLVRVRSRGGLFQLFDVQGGHELARIPAELDSPFNACISPDAKLTAYVHERRAAEVRELWTGKVVFKIENSKLYFNHVQMSPDGRHLAALVIDYSETANKDQVSSASIRLWNLQNLKEIRVFSILVG